MQTPLDLSIVVPAYNEELRLEATIRGYLDHLRRDRRAVELIVVDDGSTDGTGLLVERLRVVYPELRLIRLAENRGKGYAVRTGVVNARGRMILFADADGATPIAELRRLEQALEQGADVAIASRALQGMGVEVRTRLYRRLIGRAFHLWVEMLAVRGVRDTQCGFKLFRAPVGHDLFSRMRMDGFSFDVEMLMLAQRRYCRIAEVPVNWTHQPGSKVNLVVDSLRMALDLVVMRARSLSGEYDRPHLAAWAQPDPVRSF